MSSAAGEAASPAAGTLKKGPWTAAEDAILVDYVKKYGEGNWNAVQRNTGLSRCGKSCRLRWANHLRPNLKKGSFSPEEERLILELHAKMGNKWARMAAQLPGRTDNEIKNYWNTRIKRRQRAGLPLYPPELQRPAMFRRPTPQFGGDFPLFEISAPQPSAFFPAPQPIFQYNSLGNYDLDPGQQSFSTKMELPSNQLFPEMNAGGDLLESLLRTREDPPNARHYHLNFGFPERLEEKMCDGKVKMERGINLTMEDDLSSLLGAIPASAMASGGESNGQNSAITDVDAEMQQATSSFSIAGGENLCWSVLHRHPLL